MGMTQYHVCARCTQMIQNDDYSPLDATGITEEEYDGLCASVESMGRAVDYGTDNDHGYFRCYVCCEDVCDAPHMWSERFHYRLHLTVREFQYTIDQVGDRYAWSKWIQDNLSVGINFIAESDMWVFKEAIESDMEGGHPPFPLLSTSSELYDKLSQLCDSVV